MWKSLFQIVDGDHFSILVFNCPAGKSRDESRHHGELGPFFENLVDDVQSGASC